MSDQKVYWFKRRRYGWGWTPVTWQGWTALLIFLMLLAAAAAALVGEEPRDPETITRDDMLFVASVVLLSLCFMTVTLAKGPTPKWRWGQAAGDNPDEDF